LTDKANVIEDNVGAPRSPYGDPKARRRRTDIMSLPAATACRKPPFSPGIIAFCA